MPVTTDNIAQTIWRSYEQLSVDHAMLQKAYENLRQILIETQTELEQAEELLVRYESGEIDDPPHHISHE